MFGIFRKIIDDTSASSHIYILTGLRCLAPWRIEKVINCPQNSVIGDILASMNAERGVVASNQYALYCNHNDDPEEPVVTLVFDQKANPKNNTIDLRLDYINGARSPDLLLIGVNHNRELICGPRFKLDNTHIKAAVELSRWIVTTGLGLSPSQAFDIITRANYRPQSLFID